MDFIAKSMAEPHRSPKCFTGFVNDAAILVQHDAARLGYATHEANNHKITVTLDGGRQVEQVVRDSTAVRSSRGAKAKPKQPLEVSTVLQALGCRGAVLAMPNQDKSDRTTTTSSKARQSSASSRLAASRAHSRQVDELRQQLAEEVQVASWVCSMRLAKSGKPDAAERLAALQSRVRQKTSLG